jgi:hypothetical protein
VTFLINTLFSFFQGDKDEKEKEEKKEEEKK